MKNCYHLVKFGGDKQDDGKQARSISGGLSGSFK